MPRAEVGDLFPKTVKRRPRSYIRGCSAMAWRRAGRRGRRRGVVVVEGSGVVSEKVSGHDRCSSAPALRTLMCPSSRVVKSWPAGATDRIVVVEGSAVVTEKVAGH